MMLKAAYGVAGGMVLALAAAAPAAASTNGAASAHNKVRTFASCRAQGDFAICVAGGNVNRPVQLRVHVYASPKQRVSGAWDVVCAKGTGAGSESGTISGTTTINRKLRMPYAHPDSCTASADAQLAKGGKIHVWLTATVG